MATKLVGYEHKAGIIEGTAYNNHLFHVEEEFPRGRTEIAGKQTYVIKVRDSDVIYVLGHPFDIVEIQKAIGNDLAISFDNRGKPTHISILWQSDKTNGK